MAEVIYAGDAGLFKTCTECRIVKSRSGFYLAKNGSFGVGSVCRECQALKAREWAVKNKDRKLITDAEYRSNNRETARLRTLEWSKNNPEKRRLQEASRPPRDSAKEAARKARWAKSNPEKALSIKRRKDAKRFSTPSGRLKNAISAGVWRGLIKGAKAGKRTFEILGYTVDDLKSHLEKLFQPGMTWDNYGKAGWEVDHIVPVSSFTYETPDCPGFKSAWAISNLQPLWGPDNWAKGARQISS
ncbi:hypothetical protein ACU8NH_09210 [Rhizobium leguminosarum]